MRLSRRWKIAATAVTSVVVLSFGVVWFWCDLFETDHPDLFQRPTTRSTDLNADLKLMWATTNRASTEEAISAAERVFATVELVGLSRSEVIALLGDPRTSNDSQYNFPFYPAGCRDLVYRFDTGMGGCQYNVKFNWNGKVRRVQFLGIE